MEKKILKILQKKNKTEEVVLNIKSKRKKIIKFEKLVKRITSLKFDSVKEIIQEEDDNEEEVELTNYENLYNQITEKEFNKGIINYKN